MLGICPPVSYQDRSIVIVVTGTLGKSVQELLQRIMALESGGGGGGGGAPAAPPDRRFWVLPGRENLCLLCRAMDYITYGAWGVFFFFF